MRLRAHASVARRTVHGRLLSATMTMRALAALRSILEKTGLFSTRLRFVVAVALAAGDGDGFSSA